MGIRPPRNKEWTSYDPKTGRMWGVGPRGFWTNYVEVNGPSPYAKREDGNWYDRETGKKLRCLTYSKQFGWKDKVNKQAAGYDLLRSIQRYIDSNEMVAPEIGYQDSGNGLTFSSVLILLLNELNPDCIDKLWYEAIVKNCYKERGLLLKAPHGGFSKSQQTYDDLLSVSSACIVIGNREIPRDILKYLLMHFGFYNTTDKFRFDSWLVRHVHMIALMICAGFPFMRYALKPFLYLCSRAMNLNTTDASGMQLIWIYHAGCKGLGFRFKKYDEVTARLPACFDEYYKSIGMPFKDAARALQ